MRSLSFRATTTDWTNKRLLVLQKRVIPAYYHGWFLLIGAMFCLPLSLQPTTFQVDSDAFDALIECIAEGDFDTCQEVPAGDDDGFLVNPLGGLAVDMAGAAGYVRVYQ